MEEKTQSENRPELIKWRDFLESTPPNRELTFTNVFEYSNYNVSYSLQMPQLNLFCDSDQCDGLRWFTSGNTFETGSTTQHQELFLIYLCNNCKRNTKIYAVLLKPNDESNTAQAIKLGEYPPFGPKIPAKLITLIGSDREFFLQGWRSENQGMGIGAFTYYRRVVENQKSRLIEKIINVANIVDSPQEMISRLEEAKNETQFSKAVEQIKDAIPESLKIKTHNPLTLIHNALSTGIHNLTDEECLDRAKSVRIILTELSEKLAQSLKDDTDINQAIKELTTRGKPKKTKAP